MTGCLAVRSARIGLALATLRLAAAQTAPETFLYKQLQSFEPEAKFTPQTRKERLHAYLISLAGPATWVAEAGAAGLSQAIGSPWQWGGGAAGYGKRFANDMAYNGVRSSLTYFSGNLLQEDDRVLRLRRKAARGRACGTHSPASSSRTRATAKTVFATSNVIGIAGASLISRAWSPPSWQTPSSVARSMGISIAGTAGFNLVREFLPDIVHRLHK